jgi:hypothetical protein
MNNNIKNSNLNSTADRTRMAVLSIYSRNWQTVSYRISYTEREQRSSAACPARVSTRRSSCSRSAGVPCCPLMPVHRHPQMCIHAVRELYRRLRRHQHGRRRCGRPAAGKPNGVQYATDTASDVRHLSIQSRPWHYPRAEGPTARPKITRTRTSPDGAPVTTLS